MNIEPVSWGTSSRQGGGAKNRTNNLAIEDLDSLGACLVVNEWFSDSSEIVEKEPQVRLKVLLNVTNPRSFSMSR